MASEVSICNVGLTRLGENTIVSLTEDSKAGRLCNQVYGELRDQLLREYFWQFAITRVQLAASATAPVYYWTYRYPLPADCLRLIKPDIHDYPYKVEGGAIVTNESTVKIKYIAQITDPNKFDVHFRDALSFLLAWELAIPLTDNDKRANDMESRYRRALSRARIMGAMEQSPDTIETETWLKARIAGSSGPEGIYRDNAD